MSSDVNKLNADDEGAGNQVELRISAMQTVCINFPDGESLPKVIQLLDPDSRQTVMFKSENGSYSKVEESSVLSTSDGQCCSHCSCLDDTQNGEDFQTTGDERLDRRREKLQRKLRERKASSKDDENCYGHCHQIVQIPVQGLQALDSTSNGQISADEETQATKSSKLKEEKIKPDDLKLHKVPEVGVLGCTSVNVSWDALVSNNGHISDCNFELQISPKNTNFKTVYSGPLKEFKVTDLKAGTLYKFRLCAIKDDVKGVFSPEASVQTPCAAPSTPVPPYPANKTKTNFLLKWTAPCENGSPITKYNLEWDEGKGDGKFCEIYSGLQKQFKVTHKLPPGTPCVFRLKAVNDIGASEFSKELKCFTSAGVPSSPEPPQLDSAGVNFLRLSWSQPECNGAEIREYQLDMDDETTGYGFLVAYRGLEKRCSVEKLRRNAFYKFRLAASNSQGTSKWSNIAVFCTAPEKPGRPLAPQVQGKPKTSSFTVSWDAPSDTGGADITKYLLEMDDGQGGSFSEVYTGLDLEHTLEGLSPGHWYRLRLACVSEGGVSDWSKLTKVRTAPMVPGKAKAPVMSRFNKPQPTAIHVQWDPPDYDGGATITDYILEMENPAKGDFVELYRGKDNLCAVTGLLPGKAYKFRVRAKNEAGMSKLSNVSELSTAAGPPDAPGMPETTCRSAAAIQVTWEAPEENGAPTTGYCLEWVEDNNFVELYSGPERVFEVRKGITPATFFYFRVKALSTVGPSPWSAVSSCQTPAASPAGVTSVKVIEQSSYHMRLRWRHPSNNGATITSYNVEVAGVRNINFDVEPPDTDEEIPSVQEYSITDLLPDTVYRIRVQAVNKIGCGPFSPTVMATTGDLPPPAPLLEVATASYQSLKLRWGAAKNESVGVTYTLQMTDKLGSFATIFNGATTSHKVNKLRERTEYKFRIQATNDAGTGPFSEIFSFSTTAQPPPVVKGLKAVDVSPTALTVCWESVPCASSSEKIEYLLQCQRAGAGQDFVQVYQGPKTSFRYQEQISGNELRFRACAVRHISGMTVDGLGRGSPNKGLKGTFTPVLSVKLVSPKRHKVSEGSSAGELQDNEIIAKTRQPLTDTQWALIFFLGFAVVAVILALVVPSLIGM